MTKTNLFKAKKQEQELHILGTAHNISINVLPEFVKEFVMNHDILVVENQDVLTPISDQELRDCKFLLNDGSAALLLFSEEQRKVIKEKIKPYFDFKNTEIEIVDQLNVFGLLQLYQMALYFENGMDYSILRNFLGNKKTIQGLETRLEVVKAMEVTYSEDDLISLVNSSLNKSKLTSKIHDFIGCEFYLNNLKNDGDDGDCTSLELKTRNNNWLPKIMKLNLSSIICIGVEHLFYQYGILFKLASDGYKIERMSSDGQFIDVELNTILQGTKKVTLEEDNQIAVQCLKKLSVEEITSFQQEYPHLFSQEIVEALGDIVKDYL